MSLPDRPLRVALVGTSARSAYLYGPLLRALPLDVELVAVWGRSEESAARLGAELGLPHFTDLAELIRHTAPDLAVVSVAGAANGEVGLMVVEHGLHALLETPIWPSSFTAGRSNRSSCGCWRAASSGGCTVRSTTLPATGITA